MRKARWLVEWRESSGKPAIYHLISRIVDRRFVLGTAEKEKFRKTKGQAFYQISPCLSPSIPNLPP